MSSPFNDQRKRASVWLCWPAPSQHQPAQNTEQTHEKRKRGNPTLPSHPFFLLLLKQLHACESSKGFSVHNVFYKGTGRFSNPLAFMFRVSGQAREKTCAWQWQWERMTHLEKLSGSIRINTSKWMSDRRIFVWRQSKYGLKKRKEKKKRVITRLTALVMTQDQPYLPQLNIYRPHP